MALRVSPTAAALARALILPAMLLLRTFPRGAVSPAEVYPDAAEAARLSPADVDARLAVAARAACEALREAGTRGDRVGAVHAYFGALDPLTSLRLLSAHTRHHTARLASRTAS
jgi:predicted nuclease with RNAse H fold